MKTKNNLFAVTAVMICCLILVCFSSPTHGGKKKYEIYPQVAVPAYSMESAIAIEAYERLMEHYIVMAEKNLAGINSNLRSMSGNLRSVNKQLAELSQRMSRIEEALGIEAAGEPTHQNELDKKEQKKSSPTM